MAITAGRRPARSAAASDRTVRVWDLATGAERAVLAGHPGPVWSVAITPDGPVAVSGGKDASVRVWDLAAGREEAALTGHDGEVFAVAITAGRYPRRQRRRRRARCGSGTWPLGQRLLAGVRIIP